MVHRDARPQQAPLKSLQSLAVVMEKPGRPSPSLGPEIGREPARSAACVAQVLCQRLFSAVLRKVGEDLVIGQTRTFFLQVHERPLLPGTG